ncbi:MAG: flagellar motor switch protein FliG [Planctomycetes bacterium]|nr:flagellar motor switch protein FliG [Planctomycetota bacterium]
MALSIDKQIAILLLSIDEELAARVLRNLNEDHLDSITRAMKELQELSIDPTTIGEVYETFVTRMRQGGMALGAVGSHMTSVLIKAFGEERGSDVRNRASHEILARRPFAMFESLTAKDLCSLLAEEHPQIAAVFLAHLDRSKAGQVIALLPDEKRADMVYRVASLDRTPPEVVQRVLDVMRKKVKDLGLATLRSEPKAWVKAAAEILNNMGGGEKPVLELIEERDEGVASDIREEMFTFDDIGALPKKAMQRILGQIDTRQLAMSMKATTAAVEEAVFGNLSKRAADMVAEERDTLGPTPLSEVLEAQREILEVVRELMDSGEIQGGVGGEELV